MRTMVRLGLVAVAAASLAMGCSASSSSSSSSSGNASGGNSSSSGASSGGSSGSSGASSGGSSGSSGASGGCGRPATAIRAEGQVCASSNECQCSLDCIGNQCLRSCDPMGTGSECSATQTCLELTTPPGAGACFVLGARDEDCFATGECQTGLQCDVTATDDANDPTEATCHQSCGANNSCPTMGEECLPSTVGYYEVQLNDGGRVSCTVGMANPQCDATQGFGCVELSAGPLCSKQISACGTPVAPSDTRLWLMGFDAGTWTQADICNYGLAAPDLGQPGSLFCNNYATEMPEPLTTLCQAAFSDFGGGFCVAFCSDQDTCPANFYCEGSRDRLFYVNFIDSDPAMTGIQHRTCTVDSECADLNPDAFCDGPFANSGVAGKICVKGAPQCQPGTAPASSSSSGGASSSGGSSSGGASSSGGSSSSGGASSSGGGSSTGGPAVDGGAADGG